MRKAVITGATGAIGYALIKRLIEQNIELLIIIHKDSKRIKNIPVSPLIKILYCDLEHLSDLDIVNLNKDYDIFYHFAWDGGKHRNDFQRNMQNLSYTLHSIELAKKLGCKRYIGAGSQAEYGIQNEPLNSNTIPMPETPFGAAKLLAGIIGQKRANDLNIEYIWVRILSVYGPNDGEQTLISSLIKNLLTNTGQKLTKCEQIWDFLYSDDAAKAMQLIGQKGVNGKVYTLGSGNARPLIEFVDVINELVNKNIKLEIGSIPYSEKQVMYLCADISELTKDTGFVPETSFVDGIKNTVQWIKSH